MGTSIFNCTLALVSLAVAGGISEPFANVIIFEYTISNTSKEIELGGTEATPFIMFQMNH